MTAAQAIELLAPPSGMAGGDTPAAAPSSWKRIHDLSPACKESAVFGIDADGRLSLFDGPPDGGNVLRSFYQLNIRYMESSLPKERFDALVRGIRVSDLDEYNSVLSSFSEYAAREQMMTGRQLRRLSLNDIRHARPGPSRHRGRIGRPRSVLSGPETSVLMRPVI